MRGLLILGIAVRKIIYKRKIILGANMSFFIVGKQGRKEFQDQVGDIFSDLKFSLGNKRMELCSSESFVYCNTPPKVIDDIFIKLDDSKSWMLLVGAPVLEDGTEAGKKNFAREFFSNPRIVLRSKIDGIYAVLAYDAKRQVYLAGSDWNSLIPVYFAITNEGPIFGNAELPLAKLLQREPDEFGFAQAIHYGTVWGDRTRFKGLHKLETCELIQIDGENNIHREKYWEPHMEELWKGSFGDITQRWLSVMRDTIRVFSDHRNGSELSADLTGGEDSRMVTALLHDLHVPFRVRVTGEGNDADVIIAKKAAASLGLDLTIENFRPITIEEFSDQIANIITHSDAYGSFFTNASSFVHELRYQPMEYSNIHLCGLPGGGQFRGANYLRAKLLFPSSYKEIDYRSYSRRRFLLDFSRNLLKMSDEEYFERVYDVIRGALEEVQGFPAGIQVDHLTRVRTNCLGTAHLKRPFYFAFAPRDMTRSTYNVPPHMKQIGRQYKAIIEELAPELAWVKTQAGVPAVRRTLLRQPLFIPEYNSLLRKALKGVARQALKKATALRPKGTVARRHHELALHKCTIGWLFNTEPYASWFRSADSMLSGNQYNPLTLNELLLKARQPDFDQVQLFGRIVNQEMAFRRTYGSMHN